METNSLYLKPEKTKLKQWVLLTSLYITQYLPLGFFFIALVAILRKNGMPLEQLGIIYLIGMFWVFKFLWAPLIDKWSFGRLGHYRGWLLLMQCGVFITLYALSMQNITTDFKLIFLFCMIIGLLSATQNIAADALVYRLLPDNERGLGNSLQVAGGFIGNMIGAGVVLMAYPLLGWKGCIYLLMSGMLISITLLIHFKEPEFNHTRPMAKQAFGRLITFWKRPNGGCWFAILAIYPLGISLAYSLITPMLVDVGWKLDSIGFVVNIVGSTLGIIGALLVGWTIRIFGRRRSLFITTLIQIPGILMLLLIAFGYSDQLSVMLAVGAFFLAYSPVTTILFTLMMDHSSPQSPASDFSLQYSVFSLISFSAAAVATALAGLFSYQFVIIAAALTVLPTIAIIFRYPIQENITNEPAKS